VASCGGASATTGSSRRVNDAAPFSIEARCECGGPSLLARLFRAVLALQEGFLFRRPAVRCALVMPLPSQLKLDASAGAGALRARLFRSFGLTRVFLVSALFLLRTP